MVLPAVSSLFKLHIGYFGDPMNWNMDHSSEIEHLSASLQFLAFSDAYLASAAHLCSFLAKTPSESSYPRGAAVLSLVFHGIELFLKAAILQKDPTAQFNGKSGHNLYHLSRRYADLYPEENFSFDVPFRAEEIDFGSLDPGIAEELKAFIAERERDTPADQVYRYPRDTNGNPWKTVFAFEASAFSVVISKAQLDIARLKESIWNDN